MRWWPWPYGKLSAGLDLADRVEHTPEAAVLREDDARERVRLLYVAFTRARDLLVLAAEVKHGSACDRRARAAACDAGLPRRSGPPAGRRP